jgi:uncharacterized membrane protein YkoI
MRKISTLTLAKTMAGLLLVTALGGGTAYAASTVAHNGLLEQEEAENFAFMDADVKADEVTNLRTHLEKDDGIYVYDIKFYVGSTEYEYEIRAEDGMVLEKDVEDRSQKVKTSAAAGQNEKTAPEDASREDASEEDIPDRQEIKASDAAKIGEDAPAPDKEGTAQQNVETSSVKESGAAADQTEPAAGNKYISVDRAKQIALQDAGLKEEEVKFKTAKFEDDDDGEEYEIEFYCGDLEYEYEIDAVTGRIIESDVEREDD